MKEREHTMTPRQEPAPDPARERSFQIRGPYLIAVAASWLLPGAGHWLLGHRLRAVLLGMLLLGTFWWGEAIAGGYAVTRKEHPIFFYGQIGNGLSAVLADRIPPWADVAPNPGAPAADKIDRKIPPGLATGILLTSISGLLNLLLILEVMDPRSWAWGAAAQRGAAGPGGPGDGQARRR